ncbi:hypothetical protein BVRB_2g039430 isoform A [Beta vulgaris subsp. vulgaris]|nr:hypothetical protein BVRB_2g039430 isoform A [Beta vulgaris subsp. vulgaris]
MIAALLTDAEQRQTENNAVKVWLEDLQDLAYDLEDILDDFATEAQLHYLKRTHEDDQYGTNLWDFRFLHSAKHRSPPSVHFHTAKTSNTTYIKLLSDFLYRKTNLLKPEWPDIEVGIGF